MCQLCKLGTDKILGIEDFKRNVEDREKAFNHCENLQRLILTCYKQVIFPYFAWDLHYLKNKHYLTGFIYMKTIAIILK